MNDKNLGVTLCEEVTFWNFIGCWAISVSSLMISIYATNVYLQLIDFRKGKLSTIIPRLRQGFHDI